MLEPLLSWLRASLVILVANPINVPPVLASLVFIRYQCVVFDRIGTFVSSLCVCSNRCVSRSSHYLVLVARVVASHAMFSRRWHQRCSTRQCGALSRSATGSTSPRYESSVVVDVVCSATLGVREYACVCVGWCSILFSELLFSCSIFFFINRLMPLVRARAVHLAAKCARRRCARRD